MIKDFIIFPIFTIKTFTYIYILFDSLSNINWKSKFRWLWLQPIAGIESSGGCRLALAMMVAMFDPIEDLIAINVADHETDESDSHENSKSVVLLISDGRALHSEKICTRDTADDRYQ